MSRRARPASGRSLPRLNLSAESRNSLLLFAGLGFVVAFSLGVIGYGYYRDRIAPQHEAILTVGKHTFDYSLVERRLKYETKRGAFQDQPDPNLIIIRTVGAIEREELLRETGRAEGAYPSADEVTAQIRVNLGLPETTPQETFASLYRQDVLKGGLPVGEYRAIVAAQMIKTTLEEKFTALVPAEGEQGDIRIIVVQTQAKADEVKKRLDNGENLALVAANTSIHESRQQAGELGWVPRGVLWQNVEDVAFSLPLGAISDAVQAPDSLFYIVQTRNKEVRPIDGKQKLTVVSHSMEAILQQMRERLTSSTNLTQAQAEKLIRAIYSAIVTGG